MADRSPDQKHSSATARLRTAALALLRSSVPARLRTTTSTRLDSNAPAPVRTSSARLRGNAPARLRTTSSARLRGNAPARLRTTASTRLCSSASAWLRASASAWSSGSASARLPTSASVRLRTTVLAMLVMAVALIVGALTLLLLARSSLRDGIETTAEERASAIAAQIKTYGLPAYGLPAAAPPEPDDDLIWQIRDAGGAVVRSSQQLSDPLPAKDSSQADVPGAEHQFVVVTEEAGTYTVVVAVSLEEVDESTGALVTPLVIGVPLMLLLVGGVTWLVVTRALAPVERIRREVEEITGERLDRRVPEPPARDEIHRLARTMNRMLGRLEDSRRRQQQFVADASHELRSPLSSMRQAAEVARSHPGALPEGELAEAVLEESARMERLVGQLLLLARTGAGDATARPPQDVDLDDLALAEARRVRRAGLIVDSSRVGAGRARGDRTALAQVVRNLADNAARHARTTMAVTVRSGDKEVELLVEDDGAGIPDSQRERVFERFVRLDEARARDDGGSGLGLAIVREIVQAHGGTVTITGSPLGGARFRILLPAG